MKKEAINELINNEYLKIVDQHGTIKSLVRDMFADHPKCHRRDEITQRFGYYTQDISYYSFFKSYFENISKTKKRVYILDLGIGLGIFMRTLQRIAGLYNVSVYVVGVEIEKDFCDFARKVVHNSVIIKGDITKLTLSKISEISNVDKFDLVYSWCPVTKPSDVLRLFTNIIKGHKHYDMLSLFPALSLWDTAMGKMHKSELFKQEYDNRNILSKSSEITKEDISKLLVEISSHPSFNCSQ